MEKKISSFKALAYFVWNYSHIPKKKNISFKNFGSLITITYTVSPLE